MFCFYFQIIGKLLTFSKLLTISNRRGHLRRTRGIPTGGDIPTRRNPTSGTRQSGMGRVCLEPSQRQPSQPSASPAAAAAEALMLNYH